MDKLKPFKELIKLSAEKLDEALAPIRARQVQSKAELEVAKIEDELIQREREVTELCVKKDIDLNALIDKLDRVALLERRKVQLHEIVEQLFPKGV